MSGVKLKLLEWREQGKGLVLRSLKIAMTVMLLKHYTGRSFGQLKQIYLTCLMAIITGLTCLICKCMDGRWSAIRSSR
jgi:hypothetical protein